MRSLLESSDSESNTVVYRVKHVKHCWSWHSTGRTCRSAPSSQSMNPQSFVQASSQTIPYTALAVRRNLLACCGSMFWLVFWPLQKTYPHALAMLNKKALQIDFQYLLMVSMASTSLATSSKAISKKNPWFFCLRHHFLPRFLPRFIMWKPRSSLHFWRSRASPEQLVPSPSAICVT